MVDADAFDALVRRLTALVVKIDDRDTDMAARLAQHEEHMARLDTAIDELREFNREQREINRDLKTLMREVFHERHNGHEA